MNSRMVRWCFEGVSTPLHGLRCSPSRVTSIRISGLYQPRYLQLPEYGGLSRWCLRCSRCSPRRAVLTDFSSTHQTTHYSWTKLREFCVNLRTYDPEKSIRHGGPWEENRKGGVFPEREKNKEILPQFHILSFRVTFPTHVYRFGFPMFLFFKKEHAPRSHTCYANPSFFAERTPLCVFVCGTPIKSTPTPIGTTIFPCRSTPAPMFS